MSVLSATKSACAALNCHLRHVRLYHVFPHYLTNGTIFGKMLLNIKCVFWCYLQLFFLNTSHFKKNSTRHCHKCASLHVKYALFLSDFNETRIFTTIFEKYSNIKSHKNSSSGNRVIPWGQTNMKPIVAFRDFANAPKTCCVHVPNITVKICY
jgi:hypothetical protein